MTKLPMPSALDLSMPIPGWMSAAEVHGLAAIAATLRHGACWIEIGSYCGRSSMAVGLSLPEDSSLVLVDYFRPFDGHLPNRPKLELTIANLRQHRPDLRITLIAKASVEAALDITDGAADVVFIDADHTEGSVARDIVAWLPKLRPCGLLIGHDYGVQCFPGVAAAVTALLPDHRVIPDTSIWCWRSP